MNYKFGNAIPINLRIFKSNYSYYNGIGNLSQKECINRSLLVSGVKFVDQAEFDEYIEENHLETILK